jgi:spectinomycin phosphotransferase
VREPPPDVSTEELLAVVRGEWDANVVRLEHAPVGFGADHWVAYDPDRPVLFVTFDRVTSTRSAEDLEAAYAGAIALRRAGLEFVLAPLPCRAGSPVVRFRGGAVSCTPWRDGGSGGELDVAWTSEALASLHAAAPPGGIPRWKPPVPADFAADVVRCLQQPWGPGPYADRARDAVGERRADLVRWTARFHELVPRAGRRSWVATHGEPHSDNQLLTPGGRYVLDWESLKLAPRERDLRTLAGAGAPVDADPELIEMFDLEWRLDEIGQYVGWFAAEHDGTEDDRIAFEGLLEELNGE